MLEPLIQLNSMEKRCVGGDRVFWGALPWNLLFPWLQFCPGHDALLPAAQEESGGEESGEEPESRSPRTGFPWHLKESLVI